jgi:hypothetical protein
MPVTFMPLLSCPLLSCPLNSCPLISCRYFHAVTFMPVTFMPVTFMPVTFMPVLSCPLLSCPLLSILSQEHRRYPRTTLHSGKSQAQPHLVTRGTGGVEKAGSTCRYFQYSQERCGLSGLDPTRPPRWRGAPRDPSSAGCRSLGIAMKAAGGSLCPFIGEDPCAPFIGEDPCAPFIGEDPCAPS